ncbi:MAG: TolC family protein [Silvibacterium sp.]
MSEAVALNLKQSREYNRLHHHRITQHNSGMTFMRYVFFSFLLLAIASPARAQAHESYNDLLTPRVRSSKLAPSEHLKDYVQNGKLSLGLRDAVLLMLENNSNIQIDETQIEAQKFSLLGAHQPFDPLIQSSFNVNRYSYPGYSQLQGVGESSNATLNSLSQTGQVSYTQTFVTGTNIVAGISSSKSSTNSSFYYFNPYFSSTFNFQFTQPLWRGAGRFANTAPLIIARRTLHQSQAGFEAEVNDAILQVVSQYWAAVQARGALDVQQKSLKLAEVSYDRDKRALELGALPPLDIYRSESEVAARKVQVIQAQYALTQTEDALRLTIGADQDPQFRSLDFDLTEKPLPSGTLETLDEETALKEALDHRPEIEVAADSLANDETSIRLAHNQLRPNLSLTGFYQSSGLGGNQYNLLNGQLIAPGGLGSSFGQLFGFGYPGYGGALTLSLPLRNRGAKAGLGTALVSRTHDLYSDRQIREQITQEVSNAVHQLEEAELALAAGTTAFELAQKSLASDQRKYELGSETNFFVLDSQNKLAQAELVLLQTQVNYQIALAAVGHATGNLLDPYHVQIADLSK